MNNTPPATVHLGDCIEVMRTLPENSVDAIVTDPPYGLGFMGKAWDELPPGEEWARECLRVLKPGGHLLAFGGSRTWHRLAVAVEDAGFEVRDSIAWLYGSGFPKSLDVSKAIDKAAGAEREVLATERSPFRMADKFMGDAYQSTQSGDSRQVDAEGYIVRKVTAPATDDARKWAGFGTALKPAHEPCLVARKPAGHSAILDVIGSHITRLETEWQALEADQKTRTGAEVDSSAATGMSPSESTAAMSSSTVTSWRNCWDEICCELSTSTTATTSGTTTDLRTLSSCLSRITAASMAACATSQRGSTSIASAADNLFASVVCGLRATRELSATEPATGPTQDSPLAAAGSAAFEPIVVARKPIVGTVAANVLAHGTGALNIDGCRLPTADDLTDGGSATGSFTGTLRLHGFSTLDELRAAADRGDRCPDGRDAAKTLARYEATSAARAAAPKIAPTGGRWPANVVMDESQAAALDQMSGHLHAPGTNGSKTARGLNGTSTFQIHEREQKPGRTDAGGASRFFYVAKAPTRERPKVDGVAHPTVKPLALMRWLVRLVTPPGGTVLEPFAGSGTTVEACALEGFACIAIEREPDYLPLIQARLARVEAAQPEPAGPSLFDMEETA